jgi:Ca-activated chloride channel family protein
MKRTGIIAFVLIGLVAYAQLGNADVSRGNDFYKLSQFDKAEAAYRQALQKEPANQTALYNLAASLHQQKKYDEAIQILERLGPAAQQNIKSSVYYNQGVAYSKQKELEKSIEAYKQTLKTDPDDVQARENLQKALRELKQQQQQQQDQDKGGGGMSQKQAEQKLKQLQEKERKLQQKLQQKGQQGGGGAKDW